MRPHSTPTQEVCHSEAQTPVCKTLDTVDSQSVGYKHLGQLFAKLPDSERSDHDLEQAVGCVQFPQRPSLEVLLTLERIFNHKPIECTNFGTAVEYEQALLAWFYRLPQAGLSSVTLALERFLLPHVQGLSEDLGPTEELAPHRVTKAIDYLRSLCVKVDFKLAHMVYGHNWKRQGIGQNPLFAMASATVADHRMAKNWEGIKLLQLLFCDVVIAFSAYWNANQRDTSALANATRLALDFTQPMWEVQAMQSLCQSVAQCGGWSLWAQKDWNIWLVEIQSEASLAKLLSPNASDKHGRAFAIYLECAFKVLSAHTIAKRQSTVSPSGVSYRHPPEPGKVPIDPLATIEPGEDESWAAFLPGEDEPLDEGEDGAERFYPAVNGSSGPDDPDGYDRSNTCIGIELAVKTRATTVVELQAQAIAATYKLQATERGGREHENDFDVLSRGEFEILYNEVFIKASPSVITAANGFLNDIRCIVVCAFLGLNENQIAAMQVVESKNVKHLRALCDAKRSSNQTAENSLSQGRQDNSMSQMRSSNLMKVSFPVPFFERLTAKNADTVKQIRVHMPTFHPNHHRGKNPNVRWLVYTITVPKAMSDVINSIGEIQAHGAIGGVLAKGIINAKALFDVINTHRLTRLSLGRLSRVFKRFVTLHLPEGPTAAKYLFGDLRTTGECSSIYTRYSTEQLQQIFQRGFDGFFAQNKWLDQADLKIELAVHYDRNTGAFERVGSSRVPEDEQIKALVSHCQQALIKLCNQGFRMLTWQFMQAWSDYLLVWYACITAERANDNALATSYFFDEITGWVYSYSKTDNRCTGSTCFYVTPTWLKQAKEFVVQSRTMRLVHASHAGDSHTDLIDGERPSKARDIMEFERTLFSKAPLWIDWKALVESGHIVHMGVSKRLCWLWSQANPDAKSMRPWRGNESRHYFATKAREAGIQNEAITAWNSHWVNGQSPYRSTASYRHDTEQFKSLLEFQDRLERELGFQSLKLPLRLSTKLSLSSPLRFAPAMSHDEQASAGATHSLIPEPSTGSQGDPN